MMKVLFDHLHPFLLMHGGFQTQIEQTRDALVRIGVDVDHLRWWDAAQKPDIIHYFGRPNPTNVRFAQQKGIKVVMTQLLTGLGSRAGWKRSIQKLVIGTSRSVLPSMVTTPFGWTAYQSVDAAVLLTPWEAHLFQEMFAVSPQKVHVIPNGVEQVFLDSQPVPRGKWLVCTATITERKRVVELAEAAVNARTPLWVIGQPYSETDDYARRFWEIAQANKELIRYEGAIRDRARLAVAYREARGFVLLSTEESLSLSALEAAACQTPLLLSDLPWARTVFPQNASFCPVTPNAAQTGAALRRFYDAAPTLPPPPKPMTWTDVARKLQSLYESLLRGPAS